jgi:hypothetical protein
MKRCTKCKVEKPLDAFYERKYKKNGKEYGDGYSYECKPCRRFCSIAGHLKKTYGLSQIGYDAILANQEYRCAICGLHADDNLHGKLYVDHSHETGEVRGLLCRACNTGLGHFRDNPLLLAKAAEYIS